MNKYLKYLLYALALLPAFIFRDYTPSNELRYIGIANEALDNGSIFCFYNNGIVYADKPPLYLWFMMLMKWILGSHQMWAISLITILPSVGVIAVMDRWTKRFAGMQNTTAASIATLTTIMYLGTSLVMRMDILMTLFILLSLYSFYKLYMGVGSKWDKWLIPVYIFMAVFTKGAMGIIIPFLSMATFLGVKREIKQFGKYFNYKQLILMFGLFVAWFVMVYIEGGNEYLNNLVFKQTVGRGINSFHHKGPFYFYVRNAIWTFAPWIFLYITVFVYAIRKKMINGDLHLFFASISVSSFVILSLISSKLDVYLVPIYPFIIYQAFMLLQDQKIKKWHKISITIPAILFAGVFVASFFADKLMPFGYESLLLPRIGLGILTLMSAYGVYLAVKKSQISKAVIAIGSGFLMLLFVAAFGLEQFNSYIGFRNLGNKLNEISLTQDIKQIDFYKFRGGENLNVFTGKDSNLHLSIEEIKSVKNPDVILLHKKDIKSNKELQEWEKTLNKIDSVGDVNIYRFNSVR